MSKLNEKIELDTINLVKCDSTSINNDKYDIKTEPRDGEGEVSTTSNDVQENFNPKLYEPIVTIETQCKNESYVPLNVNVGLSGK